VDTKDILTLLFGSGIVVVVFTAVARAIILLIRRHAANQKRVDTNPFQIIPPHSDVACLILGGSDDNPFTSRNIPYQTRITGRNIRRELESGLEDSPWLLILAHTGVGKTREAINLLQTLNQEGWTILNLTREGWLDTPAHLPKGVPDRKLVFFLDDLNRKCYASRVEQSPRAGEVLQPLTVPLQDRLRRALEAYTKLCGGMGEIRVVATARDEMLSDAENEPSPWEMLQFDKYAGFWKRFKQYRLPPPDASASAKAFVDTADRAGVNLAAEPTQLARRNDGTFANIIQNLESAHVEQTALTLENFRDTLKGTWQKRYQAASRKHPAAHYVYDAVELLRHLDIDLKSFIVEPTARLIAGGNRLQRWSRRWQIRAALRYLQSAETILAPSDGQIEAKGTRVDSSQYLLPLSSLMCKLADRHGVVLWAPVFNLANALYDAHHFTESAELFERAIRFNPNYAGAYNNRGSTYGNLMNYDAALADFTRALELAPNHAGAYSNRGNAYHNLKDYDAALADFTRALELDPNLAQAYNNCGNTYHNLKNYDAALADYTRALELDPNYAEAYYNRGVTYGGDLKDYPAALIEFTRALELNPNHARAYNNRGTTYAEQKNYDAALADFTRALELDPNHAGAYSNRGSIYVEQKNYDAALADFTRALELDPNLAQAYNNRGTTYAERKNYDPALADYAQAMKLDPSDDFPVYNSACAYGLQGNVEQGCLWLRKAIAISDENFGAAQTDPDFDAIRDTPEFQALMQEFGNKSE
jgi:tetratricopeptide (TPR) repeat protein